MPCLTTLHAPAHPGSVDPLLKELLQALRRADTTSIALSLCDEILAKANRAALRQLIEDRLHHLVPVATANRWPDLRFAGRDHGTGVCRRKVRMEVASRFGRAARSPLPVPSSRLPTGRPFALSPRGVGGQVRSGRGAHALLGLGTRSRSRNAGRCLLITLSKGQLRPSNAVRSGRRLVCPRQASHRSSLRPPTCHMFVTVH